MSLSQTGTVFGESAAYGGFADAAGGIVTIVLAIVGLSHTAPVMMVSIATIVFGAALLIQGGAMLSEYAQALPAIQGSRTQSSGGLPAVFLAGAAGIVLGILALLGIVPLVLTSSAIIAFGAALVLSSNTVWHLYSVKRASLTTTQQPTASAPVTTAEMLANEMAFGSATIQALAGLAAIVLGIIALAGGGNAEVLSLVALLALGGTLILTGSTLSATVMGFLRPVGGERSYTQA
jgi:hypothetical protein